MPDRATMTRPEGRAPDSDGLRDLEARLTAARARRAPPRAEAEEHFSQANLAWRMVTELVAGLGLGLGIGLGLDALLGTRPLMLIIFVGLGFAAGVRVMMRTAQEVGRDMELGRDTERGAMAMEGARDGG